MVADSAMTSSRFSESSKLLPVIFVVCNIVGLYSIYMWCHCRRLLQDTEGYHRGVVEASVFNVISFLLVLCYVRCILVHPGTIPTEDPTWGYETADLTQLQRICKEVKKDQDLRHCKFCGVYKPDRCHHCRVCGICILKMDHHCPWIYNCVGFRNHKYFFLLLLYSAIDCQFITWTMLESVELSISNDTTDFSTLFLLLFAETLAAFLAILVTIFFCFHVHLMAQGKTTIEFCEKEKDGTQKLSWSRGLGGNIRAALGDSVLLWLLPCSPPRGDGLNFADTPEETMPLSRDLETGRGSRRKPRSHQHRSEGYHKDGNQTAECLSSYGSLKGHRRVPMEDPFMIMGSGKARHAKRSAVGSFMPWW